MKHYLTITVLAATAAFVSLAAQAQTAPLTRAQGVAELVQARSSGALERMASEGFGLPTPATREAATVYVPAGAHAQPHTHTQTRTHKQTQSQQPTPKALSGLTRAEVRAELARARAAGEMDFAAAEVNGTSPYAPRPTGAPVAPVYARQGGAR